MQGTKLKKIEINADDIKEVKESKGSESGKSKIVMKGVFGRNYFATETPTQIMARVNKVPKPVKKKK